MEHLFFFPFPVGENIEAASLAGVNIIACIPWYGEIAGLNPESFPENIRPSAEMKPGTDFPALFNSYRSLIKDLSPGEAASSGRAGSNFFDDDSIWNIRGSIRTKDYGQRNIAEKNICQWHITLLLAAEYERLEQEINRSFNEVSMKEPLAGALDPLTAISPDVRKIPSPSGLIPADRMKKIAEAWYGLFGSYLQGKRYGFILPDPSWLDSLSAFFDGEPERIDSSVYDGRLEMFRLPHNTEISEADWLKGSVAGFRDSPK